MTQKLSEDDRIFLSGFPKVREPLPEAYNAIYSAEYFDNREGLTFASRISSSLEAWMHKKVAGRAGRLAGGRLLELGAGTLNHVKYEDKEWQYDIVEPFSELVHRSGISQKIHAHYGDINEIEGSGRYERVLSVAVLEHVLDLPKTIAKSANLMVPNGLWQAAIPSEGSLAWFLGWQLKGIPFRLRTGLDYGFLTRWEHVNSAREIERAVRIVFDEVVIERFPLPLFHGSFYTYIEAKSANAEIVDAILQA